MIIKKYSSMQCYYYTLDETEYYCQYATEDNATHACFDLFMIDCPYAFAVKIASIYQGCSFTIAVNVNRYYMPTILVSLLDDENRSLSKRDEIALMFSNVVLRHWNNLEPEQKATYRIAPLYTKIPLSNTSYKLDESIVIFPVDITELESLFVVSLFLFKEKIKFSLDGNKFYIKKQDNIMLSEMLSLLINRQLETFKMNYFVVFVKERDRPILETMCNLFELKYCYRLMNQNNDAFYLFQHRFPTVFDKGFIENSIELVKNNQFPVAVVPLVSDLKQKALSYFGDSPHRYQRLDDCGDDATIAFFEMSLTDCWTIKKIYDDQELEPQTTCSDFFKDGVLASQAIEPKNQII